MRKIYFLSLILALVFGGAASAQDRPWLGVQIQDSDAGVQVLAVLPGSPAEAAGIQVDDIILAVDETPIGTAQALIETIQTYAPKDEVSLSLQRGEETLELSATLEQAPSRNAGFSFEPMQPRLGIQVEETAEGLKIVGLMPMADSDLQVDDLITAINGESLSSVQDVLDALASVDSESVEVTLSRAGEELTVDASLMNMPALFFGEVMPLIEGANLGVQFQPLDADFAANLGLSVENGALILDVQPDSAAAAAGLVAGDIVTAIDGIALDTERSLSDLISDYEAGDTINLTITRAGEELNLEATLSELRRGRMPRGGNNFGFNFEGMPFQMPRGGNNFEFRFDDLPFPAIPEGLSAATIVCTDAEGNEVFSFSFQNEIPFFQMPRGEGLNFENLNCEVKESEPATGASDL